MQASMLILKLKSFNLFFVFYCHIESNMLYLQEVFCYSSKQDIPLSL